MTATQEVFISYSHDDQVHKNWVLELATRLMNKGINVTLDQWDLTLGSDLLKFMEKGLTNSHRVLVICTDNYVKKANDGVGGVGYEKQILTAELFAGLDTNKFIPIVRGVTGPAKTPICLGGRVYADFSDDANFETSFENLWQQITGNSAKLKPALGKIPVIAAIPEKPSIKGESSTVFFSNRFSGAFPGTREITWFNAPREAIKRLSLLLKEPLDFVESSPIWWWRTGDLQIENFSILDEKTVLLGNQELVINKIAAVNAGSYYQQFVYLEVLPSIPSGASPHLNIGTQINYWGYAREEFALFNGKVITVAEHDDNAAVIDGEVVNLEGKAKARVRYLTPYNLIIAAQDHPINNHDFDKRRVDLLNELLQGKTTLESVTSEILKLPKIQRY
ncbi:toll/interleukin-1 receptor domain-containing protein [Collimonas fungivorans]|uniref:toll/interleukin-1 receptor domain-containing protein n=1 Tax=Collimonas fungivorans TaxID=158899 RepID=UPI003FA3AFB7